MSIILNEIDKDYKKFYEKLEMALSYLVDKYMPYFDSEKKERLFILNNFSRDLEKVSNLLDNYGYTYSPANTDDVSENDFEIIVSRYLEGFKKYLDGNESNIETINVNIKTLLYLVDKHKTISEHFK